MQRSLDIMTDTYSAVFGVNDRFAALLEEELHVRLRTLDNRLLIDGEPDDALRAEACIKKLIELARRHAVDPVLVRMVIQYQRIGRLDEMEQLLEKTVAITSHGKPVLCRTQGQVEYVDTVHRHELTIAEGPAGTGKTYLAVAMAVTALRNREVDRIILTRPAVEAGEKLGFLPGDMNQKIDPYLRPLYDALYELAGGEATQRLLERGTLEVAPLAFMRGRTLSHAFVILDEAQNTTAEQMKMFLTRLGAGSRFVITGDASQTDLPEAQVSGLTQAIEVLREEPAIGIIHMSAEDVVRHELVRKIIQAYDQFQQRKRVKDQ